MNFRQNAYLLFLHIVKNEAAAQYRCGSLSAGAALVRAGTVFKELFNKQIKEARHELLLSKMQAQTQDGLGETQRGLPALSEQYDRRMMQALREADAACGRGAAKHG